jgi:hypothetical protein
MECGEDAGKGDMGVKLTQEGHCNLYDPSARDNACVYISPDGKLLSISSSTELLKHQTKAMNRNGKKS